MTIRSRTILSPDLFANNESLLLKRTDTQAFGAVDALAAITFLAERESFAISLDDLNLACSESFLTHRASNIKLSARQMWMLLATGPWQYDNRITRYKGLWRLRPEFESLRPSPDFNVVELRTTKGIRYSTIVPITESSFAYAANVCRKNRECVLWLSNDDWAPSTENIQQVFSRVYTVDKDRLPDSIINWKSVLTFFAGRGDCVIRPWGYFDDREVVLDVIGQPIDLLPN